MRRLVGTALAAVFVFAPLAGAAQAGPCERWVHVHIPGYVDRCAGPIGDDVIGPITAAILSSIKG